MLNTKRVMGILSAILLAAPEGVAIAIVFMVMEGVYRGGIYFDLFRSGMEFLFLYAGIFSYFFTLFIYLVRYFVKKRITRLTLFLPNQKTMKQTK